ncbi:MAG: long-chain fatty acid--CoA ligase [Acidimicrobiia bacterium]|nr:long-chain fatty acid--CoA ligase [Acidimicrobiia bacterium]
MEVPDLLSNSAKRFPDRPAVVEGARSLTFAELHERAGRAAAAFTAAGLRRGDRVAFLAFNELEYLEILVATQRAGLIVVPLNFRLAVPELAFMVGDSAPGLLVHGPGLREQAEALGVGRTWHLGSDGAGDAYEDALDAAPTPVDPPRLDHADAAAILYTSGTTGRPKGAVLSNGAVWARCTMFGLEVGMTPGDVFVQPLPMFHMAANMSQAFAYTGGTNVMVKAFDPALVVGELARHRATHVLLVPTMINLLCEEPTLAGADLSALRMVLYGASPIPPEVLRRAIAALRCDFLQFFGMTETAGSSLLRPADHDPDGHPEWLPSAGTDSLSFETRVVDPDDRPLPPGEVGEIVCRGPSVMDGYWNAPEATMEALRGGWMHTGDLGYRSADGYLYVTDRLKDMIVSGGENVYPREVEDALYEHPAVLEAAVIGVPHERWGEAVHALVVPRAGEAPNPEELIAHCRVRLAGYKVPKSVELVDELPKNPTGKILKRLVREPYWEGHERRVG